MSYVVNWLGADGQAGWHPVADLLEAAAHVEHLRNDAGVHETKIFRLEEVAFEFKQYFRVELLDSAASAPVAFDPADPPASDVAREEAGATSATDVARDVPDTASAGDLAEVSAFGGDSGDEGAGDGSNGQRRGLFGR